MIIVMRSGVKKGSSEVAAVVAAVAQYESVKAVVRECEGATRVLTEIHLVGPTATISEQRMGNFTGVERVIRIRNKYRHIGRHDGQAEEVGFSYRGIQFNQDSFHLFPGVCAVDNQKNIDKMFAALQQHGITTSRAGAYKPRTSPYDFQGHGASCLPYLFDAAGKYGIEIISMEVTHESHVDEIQEALERAGHSTGVMLQIGTRNAQNFELLKRVGSQSDLPVLYKRGMGITLEESLNACEYLASAGNDKLVFCLRGMKTNLGDPHRNFVDFAHVPVVKRQSRLPVCIDPSHSVGARLAGDDHIFDTYHVTAQGIIAGANMVLVDFHPAPEEALCDGPQALLLSELKYFIDDCNLAREAYLARKKLADAHAKYSSR